jgi:hypothetical protein
MYCKLILTLTLIFISGCFQAHQPLSEASENLRQSTLLGQWHCTCESMEANEFINATVMLFDTQHLLVELRHSSEPEIERYRVFPTRIKHQLLWNFQELQDDATPGLWLFARIQQDGATLSAQIVRDDALKQKSETDKLAEVRQRVMDAAIFAKPTRCSRMPKALS